MADDKLPEPEVLTAEDTARIDELIAIGEGRQLVAKQRTTALAGAIGAAIDSQVKGNPAAGIGGMTPVYGDARTDEEDIQLRQEALDLMFKSLPSEAVVDKAYFDGSVVRDPGVMHQGKSLGEHVPQSIENTHLKKMMPIGWKPPPVKTADPADVEYLQFWPVYFKEACEVPTWEDLEEYDRICKRAYGSLKRGEKAKRRGFQVTGRYCRKPGCDGEIRLDPDRQVEQCFECLAFTVVQTRQHLRRV